MPECRDKGDEELSGFSPHMGNSMGGFNFFWPEHDAGDVEPGVGVAEVITENVDDVGFVAGGE